MENKPRLIGIDLLRGIAIYAVVILHSDEGVLVKPPGWSAITEFSGFAVPFFLATSFYLTIDRLHVSDRPYNLKSRWTRLLIPYGFWSVVYLLQKMLKYVLKKDFAKLVDVFQDPVAVIFFGGAAFHLYFLPLLLLGTILMNLLKVLIKHKTRIKHLILLCVMSLIAYQWLLITKNSFRLDLNIAFQALVNQTFLERNPFIRLFLVGLSWTCRCSPYIFLAMVLNNQSIKKVWLKFVNSNFLACCAIFLILNTYGSLFLYESIYEIFRGYAALLVAISLSTKLKENAIITNISACSFGIYLLHLLVVEVFQTIEKKIYVRSETISTIELLAFSALSFLVSWAIVFCLSKQKSVAKLLFGT